MSNSRTVIEVTIAPGLDLPPVDGRILVLLSKSDKTEPRFQVCAGVRAIYVAGVDVCQFGRGQILAIDDQTFGYPIPRLGEVAPGKYVAQCVLHRYETFNLATGHTVKLPMDRGEGQLWHSAPGNLLSAPCSIRIGDSGAPARLMLDRLIPAVDPPRDTEYVRHVRIQSPRLTEFWGRPMYLGAHVLLPFGFAENPDARYPLAVFHGHFPHDFTSFRETPPNPDTPPVDSERFGVRAYNRIEEKEAWRFYQQWTGPDCPRFLAIEIQHPTPYYDDSYAVNSASMGPYGDAITYELIPHVEREFRALGASWSRFLYGGSTGGWAALAAQIFYPDEYNGAFGACPDPVDFRAYTSVNLYEDTNAYYAQGPFHRVARPGHRNSLGHVDATIQDMCHLELALGTNSRSGGQFDIWQAVYSPQGSDGYPKPIWDKKTGVIDPEVAAYFREHYDLRHILQRDWETLGPKLAGKLHVYVGTMDNYYLNNAVYLLESFLESTHGPHYAGEIDYGDRAEHCWNGDHDNPIHISRLRYHELFAPRIVRRIEHTAPAGADLSSWKY